MRRGLISGFIPRALPVEAVRPAPMRSQHPRAWLRRVAVCLPLGSHIHAVSGEQHGAAALRAGGTGPRWRQCRELGRGNLRRTVRVEVYEREAVAACPTVQTELLLDQGDAPSLHLEAQAKRARRGIDEPTDKVLERRQPLVAVATAVVEQHHTACLHEGLGRSARCMQQRRSCCCLVFGERVHPLERLVQASWKPLSGEYTTYVDGASFHCELQRSAQGKLCTRSGCRQHAHALIVGEYLHVVCW